MYVYKQSEQGLFTVGYYEPGSGRWIAERDYDQRTTAAAQCRYLNGGSNLVNGPALSAPPAPPRKIRVQVVTFQPDPRIPSHGTVHAREHQVVIVGVNGCDKWMSDTCHHVIKYPKLIAQDWAELLGVEVEFVNIVDKGYGRHPGDNP